MFNLPDHSVYSFLKTRKVRCVDEERRFFSS